MHDCLLQIYMESIYQILLPLCLQSPNSLFRIIINDSPFLFCYPQVKRHLDYFTTDRKVMLYFFILNSYFFVGLSHFVYLCFRIFCLSHLFALCSYLSHLPTTHRPLDHLTTTTRSLFNFLKSGISPEFPP